MKNIISYLLQGLLLLAPLFVTIYIIVTLFTWMDGYTNDILEQVINFRLQGLGIIVLLIFITLIGYLSSTLIFRPIFSLMEEAMSRMPLIKIIYTALKDLVSAFVGDKKKFNQPVLVNINGNENFQKLGFLTQEDLSRFGLKDKVAVYLPHSYNFSGNLFIVDAKDVTILDVPVPELMKFIVSGGVTEIENGS